MHLLDGVCIFMLSLRTSDLWSLVWQSVFLAALMVPRGSQTRRGSGFPRQRARWLGMTYCCRKKPPGSYLPGGCMFFNYTIAAVMMAIL